MKKLLVLVFGLLLAASAGAMITIDLQADLLKKADGTPMPTSGLVILAASTSDTTFNAPTDTDFVSGDDIIVKKWSLDSGYGAGIFEKSTGPISFSGNWGPDDPLQLYWYPSLTYDSAVPGAGTSYGQYRNNSAVDNSYVWFTPPDGFTVGLKFFTKDSIQLYGTGLASNPAEAGLASQTTVPEPAAFATVSGLLCLMGAVAFKARRQKTRAA